MTHAFLVRHTYSMSNSSNIILSRGKDRGIHSTKCIIGVGNPLRHDDGFGPKIIEILRQQPNLDADLHDGGTDGLALLDVIAQYQQVIIIDAVNMNAPSGTLRSFSPDEARLKIHADTLSTHGFGIAEVVRLMQELAIKTDLTIIGIQPEDISFGEGLSAVVAAKIPEVLGMVK
jgi:hydrogenase maturation protease